MKRLHINNFRLTLTLAAMTAALTACETTFYDEEQYRKEIYIVSDENNMAGQEYTFGAESVGYLSIYAAGTTPIEQDVDVVLEVYPDFLRDYNQRVYGESYSSYAQEVNPSDYTIESMTATLKAGSEKCYVKFPIKVNVDNISVDEAFYIPLRIKSVSNYMISTDKREVLYRIYVKNDYATTKSTTYYTMNGTEQTCTEEADGTFTPTAVATAVNSTKVFTPIDQYSIRQLPGTTYSTASPVIRNQSIKVTVHPDEWIDVPVLDEGVPTGEYVKRQLVTLSTWQESSTAIEVAEVEGKQNYYDPDTQTFTLNYRYKLSNESTWHFMYEVSYPLSVTND